MTTVVWLSVNVVLAGGSTIDHRLSIVLLLEILEM